MRRPTIALGIAMLALAPALGAQPGAEALAAARDAARRGDVETATARYAEVIASDSTSVVALREVLTLLELNGRWQRALPFARRLETLVPSDGAVAFHVGEWLSWSGAPDSAATHLRRAVQLVPDSTRWATVLGRVLTWNAATRAEGIGVLRAALARTPSDTETRRTLATVLAWSPDTRPEARRRFAQLVSETPDDAALLAEYGDMLSWGASTRGQAERVLDRARRLAPTDTRIARSRLNVLAWSGHARRALALSDSLVRITPGDTSLLRTHAQLLAAVGRAREAATILRVLVANNRDDASLREQLAYALLASGDAGGARALARTLPDSKTPNAADWVRRALDPAVGFDVVHTHTSLGLTLDRVVATASTPAFGTGRLSLAATPTWLDAPTGSYQERSLAAALERRTGGLQNLRGELGIEQYVGAGTTWSGAVEGVRALEREGTLRVRVSRAAVEDSRRSARGTEEDGQLVGQVRANLLTVAAHVRTLPAGLTFDLTADVGPYTARGLRTNVRRELQTAIFHDYPTGRANFEAGLGAAYLSFAYDANRGGAAPVNERGAYWSPRDYGNVFGRGSAFYQITGRSSIRVDAALGYLVLGRPVGTTPWNISAASEARWTARHGWDLTAGGLYLDNRAGFRMQQLRAGIRHAF